MVIPHFEKVGAGFVFNIKYPRIVFDLDSRYGADGMSTAESCIRNFGESKEFSFTFSTVC